MIKSNYSQIVCTYRGYAQNKQHYPDSGDDRSANNTACHVAHLLPDLPNRRYVLKRRLQLTPETITHEGDSLDFVENIDARGSTYYTRL